MKHIVQVVYYAQNSQLCVKYGGMWFCV